MTAETAIIEPPKLLHPQHGIQSDTNVYKLIKYLGKQETEFSFWDLHKWSTENISQFWASVWDLTGIVYSSPYSSIVDETAPMFPRPEFFAGARLNYAENLLYPKNPSPDPLSTAVIGISEGDRLVKLTWTQLRSAVASLTTYMRHQLGVKVGDRVAAFVNNNETTLIAVLATAAVGAIWTSTSSEIGVEAVIDRFAQIQPIILFVDTVTYYNGKTHTATEKINGIIDRLPTLTHVIHTGDYYPGAAAKSIQTPANTDLISWTDIVSLNNSNDKPYFEQLPFDHPLFIVYSSGTTGLPKCIVHSAGGTLIQHKKEHYFHMDMGPNDVFFQYTTCSWMMWQWLISALASTTPIILYDGSPFHPNGDMSLWDLCNNHNVSIFGTSAKYLTVIQQRNVKPVIGKNLRMITSTASVLPPSTYEYIYKLLGSNIILSSITGGTDILSLFGAPSTVLPVYQGEIQCKGLGMDIQVWDSNGINVESLGLPGDLVCIKSFPAMPIGFYTLNKGIESNSEKYRTSYFDKFPGIWHHGDYLLIDPFTHGWIMLGRSDGVLKPAGVRFGSSEIYNILSKVFPSEIDDAICVGRRRPNDSDETVCLFVKTAQNKKQEQKQLESQIASTIRQMLSARHVPAVIAFTPEIPYTANGKKTEILIKQIVSGAKPILSSSSSNKINATSAVANPDCLEWYYEWYNNNNQ